MDIGLFNQFNLREGADYHQTLKEWLDLAVEAEDLGVDSFWFGETHFRPNRSMLSSPLIGASAVAARTSQMKVGTAVQVLPLADPVRIAEEAALVDHLSDGRLVFGVGRSSFIDSYNGFNINYEESRDRFRESLEVIQQAWGDAPFSYEGEYYTVNNVSVVPKPYQKPHPPIRMAAESQDTFPMAGRMNLPIFMRFQMPIPQLKDLLRQYGQAREEAGYSGPNDVILQIPVYVADTAEQARSEPEASVMLAQQRRSLEQLQNSSGDAETYERMRRMREGGYESFLERAAFGTPEAVENRLRMFVEELGITGFALDPNSGGQIPRERVLNSMRLLMEEVAPRFK
ncbi:MAG: LLM class flavin-dependent oxidoreductase [Dehalococcoidia bacterium]